MMFPIDCPSGSGLHADLCIEKGLMRIEKEPSFARACRSMKRGENEKQNSKE